ncbi:DNA-processing protein DprA [Lactobacillus intestinalis]|uniref:DNA-processing protein DprA n=1 Tax=Lactobacillus intestinalis TaxID=151781 RepID=UPI002604DF65|nr:DNA-processing protein DprA [Lactobacillus intestinalis]
MNRTDFLLRLKLERGIGYIKMLQIASQLDSEKVEAAQLKQLDLPEKLIESSLQAFYNEKYEKIIDRIRKQCSVISFFDDLYPNKLRQIYQPPLILFARGNTNLLKRPIATIVGARQATNYSQVVIDELMLNLIKKYVIASGLARGVDGMAHESALHHGGKTVAVVGNGINHFYPAQNKFLQQEIVEKGLLISEYLPDTPPKPFRFPERNRILAGLSDIVIVTEAREKSGSLITANMALHENRDVYAVPGPITCDLSKGPNRLIEVGAIPIVDFKLEEPFQNIE